MRRLPTRCPSAVRDLPAWVGWRFEQHEGEPKPRKVPYYAHGGRRKGVQGGPEDLKRLVTFDTVLAAAERKQFDGVGFCPLPQWGVTALDFDRCVDADGRIHPEVEALLGSTYCELSPSGRGVRAFFLGDLGNRKDHGDPFGFETFSGKGFVTVTGDVLDVCSLLGNEDTVAPVDAPVLELVGRRFRRQVEAPPAPDTPAPEPVGLTQEQLEAALAALDADGGHEEWLRTGMALHHETGGAGFDLWDTWSATSTKYPGREALEARWRSFGQQSDGPQVTARSLVRDANAAGAGIDLHGAAGADEFEVLVDTPAPPATPHRFPIESAAAFAEGATPRDIIKGVLPEADLVVMYGASGSGKSFMALDLVGAIALGRAWRGRRTHQRRVVYVAAEGAGGFRKRVRAYGLRHGVELADLPLGVISAAPNLMEKADAAAIAKSVKAWGGADIIVVDTFAQVMPGANENAGEDVGKALAHCKRISEATGAMIILIHHSGKDASKGSRGWSGLKAAADAELEVVRTPQGRALKLTKSKDGEDGLEWGFDLEVVELGVDEDLDPITSCVVIESTLPTRALGRELGPIESIVNSIIQEFAEAQTSGIEVTAVIVEAVRRMPNPEEGKRDTRKQRARRALEKLCEGDEAPYWLGDDGCLSVL